MVAGDGEGDRIPAALLADLTHAGAAIAQVALEVNLEPDQVGLEDGGDDGVDLDGHNPRPGRRGGAGGEDNGEKQGGDGASYGITPLDQDRRAIERGPLIAGVDLV